MSKIKELLNDKESVLVFDVDGVLALLELGEYNHFSLNDEEWFKECERGINYYTENKVINKMKNFTLFCVLRTKFVLTYVTNLSLAVVIKMVV